MKRSLALLLLLTGCVGGWNPFGPPEPAPEPCVTFILVDWEYSQAFGWQPYVDSMAVTGEPPCIEVTEVAT